MFAATSTSIAWVILLISLAGWAFYAFSNIRSSRAEIGSEQKLAANRKEYYDDEILEGPRLERVLLHCLCIGFLNLLAQLVLNLVSKSVSPNGEQNCSPPLLMVDSTVQVATAA
jgi:hypothetical protein